MDFSLKQLAAATLVMASLTAFSSTAYATLTPQQSAVILKTFNNAPVTDFRQFLGAVAKSELAKTDNLEPTISAFIDHKALTAEQQNEIYRLLGLYTRLKYGQAATETLRELVAIPTVNVDGVPQYENPQFLKIADKIKDLAKAFNLNFRNIDNRVYEVSLEGSGDEVVGIHAHADVVPVTPENWVLKDGTKLDPFKVTLIGDRMYGRGTEDDKNGIVVAMYAMKVIKEEKLPLARNFKLLIDTTEETSGDAIPYYFEHNPVPNYTLAPGKAGHNGAVAFLGNHHRVAAIQRQVVVGYRVVFKVVRDGITGGFFGGVDQQLEVTCQWQLFFLDHLHGVHRHHDAVFVILGATPIHAVADQGDLERIEFGAVLEHPVFRGHRHYVSVGVNAHHFIACTFEGNLIDAVVDIAEVEVEGLGQVLDLFGNLEKLRILVLGHVVQVDGGDGYQFTQGFGGRLAVFEAGVEPQQTIDFVLLVRSHGLVVEKGPDGRAQVIVFRQLTLAQSTEKLTEVSDLGVAEGLEDNGALLRGNSGVGCAAERGNTGQYHGCDGQMLK